MSLIDRALDALGIGEMPWVTRAWVRREGETGRREMFWDAWRKVPVIRRSAA
jgi:hypothetical protein